jgi:hypothetical protein
MNECINRAIEASDGELNRKSVTDIWEQIQKKKEAGASNSEMAQMFVDLDEAKLESMRALRRFNHMKDFSLRKDTIQRILDTANEVTDKGFVGQIISKLGYSDAKARMKRGLLDYYRVGEQWVQNANEVSRNQMHLDLAKGDLVDFAYSGKNDDNIIREMAALADTKNTNKGKSITGDDKAFRAAQVLQSTLENLHKRKVTAGSIVNWKDGFITSNMWDDSKLVQYTDEEFFEIVKDIDWGDKGTFEDWQKFKASVQNRTFIDEEDFLLQRDIENSAFGDMSTGSSLAEVSGASRTINLTTEQYVKLAPLLFKGDTFAQRMGHQINKDSRIAGQLEWFGSNPQKQVQTITDQLMTKTLTDKRFLNSQGKHMLTSGFFGGGQKESQLSQQFFGALNNPDDPQFAAVFQAMRGFEALTKLPLAGITAQADAVTRAARQNQLLNGESSIIVDTGKAFADSVAQFGRESVEIEGRASIVGLVDMLDNMSASMRYMGESEGLYNGRGIVKKTNEIIQEGFKLNQLEKITNMNLRASYRATQSLMHSLKGRGFDQLSDELRLLFRSADLSEAEWQFISKHGELVDGRGSRLLAIEPLNNLELDAYAELYPGLSKSVLQDKKSFLSSKWNTILRKEARTSTIMPDIVDNARLNRGTKKGTGLGELVRAGGLFRSFTFGVTARILTPLALTSKLATQGEYLAAMTAITMLIKTEQALVTGKTPPDFTNPQTAMGVAGMVIGLPFIDQLAFILTSDNPQQNTIPDLLAGPLLADLGETIFRAIKVGQDVIAGKDPKFAKQLLRTIGPASPTRVTPGVSVFHDKVYNNLMDHMDSKNRSRRMRAMKDRGQSYIFGN